MEIKGIYLSWVVTADIAKAKKFFTDIGLQVAEGSEEYKWFEFTGKEGGLLGVGEQNDCCPYIKPGQNAVVTFTVDDIVAAKANLEAKGVKFSGEIEEVPGHVKMALFADPDGNLFQLVEDLSQK